MFNEDDKSTINYDELVRLLDEENNPKPKKKAVGKGGIPDVLRFIKSHGLQKGEIRVPSYRIYYCFIKWAPQNWSKTWGNTEFFRIFKKQFEQKRTGRQRYYLLNTPIDETKEYEEKAKAYYQKWVKSYNRGEE